MAGTRTTTGANTTYKFEWTKATASIDAIADAAAHYLWDHGYGDHGAEEAPILYSDLTVAQKLAILNAHLAKVLTDAATTYKSNTDQDEARIAADEYAKTNYTL